MTRRKTGSRDRARRGSDFDLIDNEARPVNPTPLPKWEREPPLSYDDYHPIRTPRVQAMAVAEMKRQQTELHGVVHTREVPVKTRTMREQGRPNTEVIEPDQAASPKYDKRYRKSFVAKEGKSLTPLQKVLGCKERPLRSKSGKGGRRAFMPWCK